MSKRSYYGGNASNLFACPDNVMKASLALCGGAAAVVLVAAMPFLAMSYSGGAPSAFSGPEQTCNACHGIFGDVNTGTGSVTISAPDTYVAGTKISITVTVDNTTPPVGPTPRQGFMLSARDADGSLEHVGEFDLDGSTLVRFGSGGNPANDSLWVTHTSSSNEMTSWTFSWVAPSENAPEMVILYAAGNGSNANGSPDDGDFAYTTTHTMTQVVNPVNEPVATSLTLSLDSVAPNPFRTETEVIYSLDESATVRVVLRDGRGRTVRELANGPASAGSHQLRLSAEGLASGVYFLTVYGPDGIQTRPLTISR